MSWAEIQKERLVPWFYAAIFAVINSDGKILVEDRVSPESGHFGYTIIPGGAIEEGETPRQALEREMDEELGVKPTQFTKLPVFLDMTLSNRFVEYSPYVVLAVNGEVANKEPGKSRHRWIDLEEACNLPLALDQLVAVRVKEYLVQEGLIQG